jgi:hypothetical protein
MADEREGFTEQQDPQKRSNRQADGHSQPDDLEPRSEDADDVKGGRFVRSDSSDPQEGGGFTG